MLWKHLWTGGCGKIGSSSNTTACDCNFGMADAGKVVHLRIQQPVIATLDWRMRKSCSSSNTTACDCNFGLADAGKVGHLGVKTPLQHLWTGRCGKNRFIFEYNSLWLQLWNGRCGKSRSSSNTTACDCNFGLADAEKLFIFEYNSLWLQLWTGRCGKSRSSWSKNTFTTPLNGQMLEK